MDKTFKEEIADLRKKEKDSSLSKEERNKISMQIILKSLQEIFPKDACNLTEEKLKKGIPLKTESINELFERTNIQPLNKTETEKNNQANNDYFYNGNKDERKN